MTVVSQLLLQVRVTAWLVDCWMRLKREREREQLALQVLRQQQELV